MFPSSSARLSVRDLIEGYDAHSPGYNSFPTGRDLAQSGADVCLVLLEGTVVAVTALAFVLSRGHGAATV